MDRWTEMALFVQVAETGSLSRAAEELGLSNAAASRHLSASLCGQLIVSETIFALLYSFAWDGRWPTLVQLTACVLFTLGILASIRALR